MQVQQAYEAFSKRSIVFALLILLGADYNLGVLVGDYNYSFCHTMGKKESPTSVLCPQKQLHVLQLLQP